MIKGMAIWGPGSRPHLDLLDGWSYSGVAHVSSTEILSMSEVAFTVTRHITVHRASQHKEQRSVQYVQDTPRVSQEPIGLIVSCVGSLFSCACKANGGAATRNTTRPVQEGPESGDQAVITLFWSGLYVVSRTLGQMEHTGAGARVILELERGSYWSGDGPLTRITPDASIIT